MLSSSPASTVHVLLSALLLAGGAIAARAQPVPKLNSIEPASAQRGRTVELAFKGENIGASTLVLVGGGGGLKASLPERRSSAVQLLFSGGGIRSEGGVGKAVKVSITIDADAAPGPRTLRLATPWGVTSPQSFFVSDLPIVRDSDAVTEITLPALIEGVISNEDEADTFAFEAEKGERLLLDVRAYRMRSPLDATLELLDSEGAVLAMDEDTNGLDPLIDFEVPETGRYQLRVRDMRHRGGGAYAYRIRAGVLPYIDSVFPLGGGRGERTEIKFTGRNLGGAGSMTLLIDSAAPLGTQDIRASCAAGLSNSRPFVVGKLPEMTESEPNNEAEKANRVSVPTTVNGKMGEKGDADVYRFHAEKGATIVAEVAARRLGSSLDALLLLTDSEGERIEQNDDAAGADARIVIKIPKEGDYDLTVRDLLWQGGENYGYRLTLRLPNPPEFSVRFAPRMPRVARGGSTVVKVTVTRTGGFSSPVRAWLEGLPEGVRSKPFLIQRGQATGLALVTASEQIAEGLYPFRLKAEAVIGARRVTREAPPAPGPGELSEAYLTVTEPSPFSLDLLTLAAEVRQQDSTELAVNVQRHRGFDGEITLYVTDAPDNVGIPGKTLGPEESAARLRARALPTAQVGSRPLVVRARAKWNGAEYFEAVGPIDFTVVEAPFVLLATVPRLSLTAEPESSQTPAGEAVLKVKVDRRGWFTDKITLNLGELPEGVRATEAVLAPGETEAFLKIRATEEAPLDEAFKIRVRAATEANGRKFSQRSQEISITVTKPVLLAQEE